MAKIWANRLIDGDRWKWSDVPANRKNAVKAELKARVANGIITPERYTEIVGEAYTEE